jgi:hypothetical protein
MSFVFKKCLKIGFTGNKKNAKKSDFFSQKLIEESAENFE